MALETHHRLHTVQEFADLYRQGRLNLNPAFQRDSVWSVNDRRLLISSLLDDIPIPSIYLYSRVGRGGKPVFDVIDGKQRLESILLFMKKGPLVGTEEIWVRRSFPADADPDWWAWHELNSRQRNEFLTARLPTIEVEGELEDIINLFVRINSTGRKLTGQEQRHARYYKSPVLRGAQKMGDELAPGFQRDRVLSPGQVQRMRHVELTTELLLSVHDEAPLNKKKRIDDVIRGDGLTSAEVATAGRNLKSAIKLVHSMLPDLKTTRFHQVADYYTLVLLTHRYRAEGHTITAHDGGRNALAGALLRDFGLGVDRVSDTIRQGKGVTPAEEPFREYLATVREGTDSLQNRKRREQLLRQVLDGVFEPLDTSRTFNTTQRRILWHASAKKRCSVCKKPILRWEDLSIDHVRAYVKGGRTSLANAAIAHRRCNSGKGAR